MSMQATNSNKSSRKNEPAGLPMFEVENVHEKLHRFLDRGKPRL